MGTVTQWVLGFSYGNSDRMSPPLLQIFYKHPTQVLVHQWPKHIANGSDYVEEWCFVLKICSVNIIFVLRALVVVALDIK